ncbi:hypothetical protein [Microcella sp.]|uniref:hypothetical protein n=1 Tax=Microcella sp. TaxID=1913979 RepID=UPI002566699F|nr:hypothetical protein [Microcella sp.]MBX9472269.1 hypothetical protein [Microcella sp.]
MRARSVAAGALATVGLLLVPGAVMAHWATVQLVETERFVEALAPLADNPAVQDRIIVEVTALVDEQVDISGVTSDLLSGLGEALELGDRAQDALELVSEPIAAGVRALVADVVGEVVRSPAFSSAWASSVELLHAQGIRLLSGSPDSLLELDRDGTLRLPLGPIVADVRAALVAQGVPFAAAIPDIDRSIVIAEVPNLALARVIYQVGIAIGVWLPWVTAALIAGAILLSPRRALTLRTVGVFLAVIAGLLAIGFALARTALTAYVGPESSALVGVVFDAVLGYATTTILALLTLGVLVGLVGWWFGPGARVSTWRARAAEGMSSARAARARSGFGLGRFGEWMLRERLMVHSTLIALAIVPALLTPPLSVLSVLASALLALGLIVLAEVLMSEPAAVS